VLGVVDDLSPPVLQVAHRFFDHAQIFFGRGVQGFPHMQIPRLPEHRRRRGAGRQDQPQVFVALRGTLGPARAAKCRDAGVPPRPPPGLGEEFQILWVASRPTPFDVINPEFVQTIGEAQLVLGGQGDSRPLGPVPESRVVEGDPSREHCGHATWCGVL
jgi:hypothetical protein